MRCDERAHINNRPNWDEDVSLNWIPRAGEWRSASIHRSQNPIFVRISISQVSSRFFSVAFYFRRRLLQQQCRKSEWVTNWIKSLQQEPSQRLTDIWRFSPPAVCLQIKILVAFLPSFMTNYQKLISFLLSARKSPIDFPPALCLFRGKHQDSVRDKSIVLE